MKKIILRTMLYLLIIMAGVSCTIENQIDQEPIMSEPAADTLAFNLQDPAGSQSRTIYSSQPISTPTNPISNPYVELVANSGDQYLVKINLRPNGKTPYSMVQFDISYKTGTTRTGYQVNIGDSETNHCGGVDNNTQSNDSELQVINGILDIFPKESTVSMKNVPGWWAGQVMHFQISNNTVTYWLDSGTKTSLYNMKLFALNGQPDTQGSKNYVIYAAFNRTVGVPALTGSGVGDVTILLQNPAPVNAYYGLLHNHSLNSDGTGTPAEAYSYARDNAKLDFFALADHDYHSTKNSLDKIKLTNPSIWTDVKNLAASYNVDHSFVAFHAYEWSSATEGHITILNSSTYVSNKTAGTDTFGGIMTWLKLTTQAETVAFFNHPAEWYISNEFSHFTRDYRYLTDRVVGIELFNALDDFSKFYYQNDEVHAYLGYSSTIPGSFFDEANYSSTTVGNGWHIGAAGSDDNHVSTWGTRKDYRLAILAAEKTRAALLGSMKVRRFYSTLDKNLYLWFDSTNNPMGTITSYGTNYLTIAAHDTDTTDTFTKVQLYKNGAFNKEWNSFTNPADIYIEYPLTSSKLDFYYIKVTQADGDEAISSPIYTC